MRRILIIAIIVIILIAAAVIRIGAGQRKTAVEEVSQAVPVEVIPVTRGEVMSTCEVLGTVVADKTASVFPETMGRITRILVKEGTYVSKNNNIMAMRNETIGFEYEEVLENHLNAVVQPQTAIYPTCEGDEWRECSCWNEDDLPPDRGFYCICEDTDELPDLLQHMLPNFVGNDLTISSYITDIKSSFIGTNVIVGTYDVPILGINLLSTTDESDDIEITGLSFDISDPYCNTLENLESIHLYKENITLL